MKLLSDIKKEFSSGTLKKKSKEEGINDEKAFIDLVSGIKTKKMRCSDGVVREVDILLFKKSKLLRDIIEDYLDEDSEILLLKVDSKYLDLIVQYLEHYKDMESKEIPKPFPDRTDDAFLRGIVNDDWTFNYLQNMSIQEVLI